MSAKMREALKLAIRQNEHDMLMTGEELRLCHAALAEQPAQGDLSPEDRYEQFIQAAIDQAPKPLRRLGEYLTKILDEDHWPTAERLLLGIAVRPAPAVPDGWKLVPVEPTDDMEGTACHELRERGCPAKLSDIQVAWSVMLAAAPEPRP